VAVEFLTEPAPGATPPATPAVPAARRPSGHDRHADTLHLPTVFSKLDGRTRFPAPLLPAPQKILETCLDSRDNELFQELEAIKGRRREARAAKESGRKEHRSWDKPTAGLIMMPPNPAARGRASTRHRPAGLTFWSRTGA